MTTVAPVLRAAAEAIRAFGAIERSGCVIGGLALLRWGQPRFTQDADLTLLVPPGEERDAIDALLAHLAPRSKAARDHALRHRVLLLMSRDDVPIDISLAASPFEEEVLARATQWRRVDDVWLTTCSAEDLVIYKLIAARGQDLVDVESIVRRQKDKLDTERIRRIGAQFAELKEDPDLMRPFEEARIRSRA